MYFLDTTAIIELFRGNEGLRKKLEGQNEHSAVTTLSYFEIFSRIAHKRMKREETYFKRFFATIPVYSFNVQAARESCELMASLLKRGTPVNSLDVMIAGIARANGAEGIVTRDKDFRRLEEVSDLEMVFF